MYVNPQSEDFDQTHEYVFLRRSGKELLLLVANFSDQEQTNKIHIPQHAFDFLNIPQKEQVTATELITGKKTHLDISPELPVCLTVPALSGCIWKIRI